MKKAIHILFFLGVVISACAQQPQTIKLTQLETAPVDEGTRAGQIGLTDTNGKQRYAQYTEINPGQISYFPTSTGNTMNISEFVMDPDSNIWYIDWQGRGLELYRAGGGGIYTSSPLQGDGTLTNPITFLNGNHIGQYWEWNGSAWVLDTLPTDKNGYYGGNGGNGGDNTIPSNTYSTVTDSFFFLVPPGDLGGTAPINIVVTGTPSDFEDYFKIRAGSDSLLIYRSDQDFTIQGNGDTQFRGLGGVVLKADNNTIKLLGVPQDTSQHRILRITTAGVVKYGQGINWGDLTIAVQDSIRNGGGGGGGAYTSGPIQGDGSFGDPITFVNGTSAGQYWKWNGTTWALDTLPLDKNGYYGGNGGNGGDGTIPSKTTSTVTDRFTFSVPSDPAGGYAPINIQSLSPGSTEDYFKIKAGNDSLTIYRSTHDFYTQTGNGGANIFRGLGGITLYADNDAIKMIGVPEDTTAVNFLMIAGTKIVKYRVGIGWNNLNQAVKDSITAGLYSVTTSGPLQGDGTPGNPVTFDPGTAAGQYWKWNGTTWVLDTLPASTVTTSGPLQGNGTAGNPVTFDPGTISGQYWKWNGTAWALDTLPLDKNGYYGGNGGNGGDGTIPSKTTSTVTDRFTFSVPSDPAGGYAPINIQSLSPGSTEDYFKIKAGNDSLTIYRSTHDFYTQTGNGGANIFRGLGGITLYADNDAIKMIGVPEDTTAVNFLMIAGTKIVKYRVGIGWNNLNQAVKDSITAGLYSVTTSGPLQGTGTPGNPVTFDPGTVAGQYWKWNGSAWVLDTLPTDKNGYYGGNGGNGGDNTIPSNTYSTVTDSFFFLVPPGDLGGTAPINILVDGTPNDFEDYFKIRAGSDSLLIYRSDQDFTIQGNGDTQFRGLGGVAIKADNNTIKLLGVPQDTSQHRILRITTAGAVKYGQGITWSDLTQAVRDSINSAGGGGTGDVNNGGNSYGAAMSIGTNDDQTFSLRRNGTNWATLSGEGIWNYTSNNSTNAAPLDVMTIGCNYSGTPTTNFGTGLKFLSKSATVNDRELAGFQGYWVNATDVTRTSGLNFGLTKNGSYGTAASLTASTGGNNTFTIYNTPGGSSTLAMDYTSITGSSVLTVRSSSSSSLQLQCGTSNSFAIVCTSGSGALTSTTLSKNTVKINDTYTVSSGSGSLVELAITPTFNLTGTASGAQIGAQINPTFTSLTGTFRGIDLPFSNANAYGVYQSGTAKNVWSGQTFFGGTTSPTALVNIAAGTTSSSTAPLKFTAGSLMTTPEAFALEADANNLYETKNSGLRYVKGGNVKEFDTGAQNSGTSETDLFSYTAPANFWAINGDRMEFDVAGSFTDVTATADMRFYVGGNKIYDTGALNLSSSNGSYKLHVTLMRSSSTQVKYMVTFEAPGTTLTDDIKVSTQGSLTLSSTNVVKLTGQAGGGGGGTGDIIGHFASVDYYGANQ